MKIVLGLIYMTLVSFVAQGEAMEDLEIYLAGYGMATQPSNQGLTFDGGNVSKKKIHGDFGLGVKIGLFPSYLYGYLGMELETFGHNNSLKFRVIENSVSTNKGKSSLVTYGSMVNLLLRYPGRYARPYIGIGGGLSSGILHHADIPGRKDKTVETDSALGHQFFGGLQLVFAKKWVIFGEYKYSAANYHWNQLSLNFRSEYFLGGFGYVF